MRRYSIILLALLTLPASWAAASPWDMISACDVSGDGFTDVIDVQELMNAVLSGDEDACPGGSCDVNGDGGVDVLDVQLLNRVVLGLADCPGDMVEGSDDIISCPGGSLTSWFSGECHASADTPLAAIEACDAQLREQAAAAMLDVTCAPCEEEPPYHAIDFLAKPCKRDLVVRTPFSEYRDPSHPNYGDTKYLNGLGCRFALFCDGACTASCQNPRPIDEDDTGVTFYANVHCTCVE